MVTQGTSKPPAGLDATSRALWRRLIVALREQGTWQDSDATALLRYVLAEEVGRHARVRIARRVKANADSAYTTRGSQGQLVQHPDLKTARDAERDAATYAADLLLTPKARAQHRIAQNGEQLSEFDRDLARMLGNGRND